MMDHYRSIREHDLYSRSRIVVFYESNGDWGRSGRGLDDICSEITNIETAKHRINNILMPGVLTTPSSKPGGAQALQRMMYDNRIHLAHQFISQDPEQHRGMLFQQLRNLQDQRRPNVTDPGMQPLRVRSNISGKDKTGAKDDVVTALHQCIYHMKRHQAASIHTVGY
jgi:hypothetical protein